DAPTLFQAGADRFCHSVVSVIAPEKMRFARILARDGMTEEAAKKRLAAQEEDSFYTDRSEFVIVNDGSLAELTEKTEALAQMLWRKAGEK
ncbi:MAG: dephospho-CoA kinase, partial [Oscillospiraceae bacterium]|nr:dephospho-CoA kinase [Oscillospiraceae bacterium]